MKKILIVEDEEAYTKLLHDQLQKVGYEVVQAKNGEEGTILALKEKPDLILLDIRMPVIDGLTMLNILREDEWGNKVPVIALTNLSDEKTISNSMNDKVTRFMIKSDTKLDDLIAQIKLTLHSMEKI